MINNGRIKDDLRLINEWNILRYMGPWYSLGTQKKVCIELWKKQLKPGICWTPKRPNSRSIIQGKTKQLIFPGPVIVNILKPKGSALRLVVSDFYLKKLVEEEVLLEIDRYLPEKLVECIFYKEEEE